MWAQEAVPFLNVGPEVPLWVRLAVADWGVKMVIALIALGAVPHYCWAICVTT